MFIGNVAEVACVSAATGTGGLAFGLAGIADVLNISDITQYLDYYK